MSLRYLCPWNWCFDNLHIAQLKRSQRNVNRNVFFFHKNILGDALHKFATRSHAEQSRAHAMIEVVTFERKKEKKTSFAPPMRVNFMVLIRFCHTLNTVGLKNADLLLCFMLRLLFSFGSSSQYIYISIFLPSSLEFTI